MMYIRKLKKKASFCGVRSIKIMQLFVELSAYVSDIHHANPDGKELNPEKEKIRK